MTQKAVLIKLTGTVLGDEYKTVKPLYRDEIQFYKDCWRQLKNAKHWSIEQNGSKWKPALITVEVDELADYEAIKKLVINQHSTVQEKTGKTQQQWADQYGISRSRVGQLYQKWGTLSDELLQNRNKDRTRRKAKVSQ